LSYVGILRHTRACSHKIQMWRRGHFRGDARHFDRNALNAHGREITPQMPEMACPARPHAGLQRFARILCEQALVNCFGNSRMYTWLQISELMQRHVDTSMPLITRERAPLNAIGTIVSPARGC